MTRRRVWQGIRDWFRPVESAASKPRSPHIAHRSTYDGGAPTEAAADAAITANHRDSELLDFLAADLDPVEADPVFREQLRERLWGLVQDGAIARPKDH